MANTSLPQSKVTETVEICDNIVSQLLQFVVHEATSLLKANSVDILSNSVQSFFNALKSVDLFNDVKTYSKQKTYLEQLAVQIPQPVEKCVGKRIAIRKSNNIPKSVCINETFTYLPIAETLKLIFRDPHNRMLLQTKNAQETPGIKEYSSFETGLRYEASEYFKRYPNAIRLTLYEDDVELGNPLSSRAGKNKIANFLFKVQNFPDECNSSPKTIFPLIFASSRVVKKYGCNKIMEPLIADLKKLEKGVTI